MANVENLNHRRTAEDVLKIEGIIIRFIARQSTSLFEGRHFKNLPNQTLFFDERYGREMCREVHQNSLGGQYLVTVDCNQGQNLMNAKWGRGATPVEAYQNYLEVIAKK